MDEQTHDHSTQEWRRLQTLRLRDSVVSAMQRARTQRLNESLRSFAVSGRNLSERVDAVSRG